MMPTTVHSIFKYTVQILNTKGNADTPKAQIIVRLLNKEDKTCGVAVFKDYGETNAQNPYGDHQKQTATAYYDIKYYQSFVDILRLEKELFWKIAWQQIGPNKTVLDVSLDTKAEIIGEHFGNGGA
ncbi:hypothetical protein O4H49_16975 [Kiloniella laminariae]|uniref:Uncharacterized protein n=1 Tax=Kiloniella laminariae TaxID=454162 RepID=A0ABT4LN21_9PROT|nr:hypothetical protein [Kiloniella laminariae]MCZ4282483.1 hypothetical protein [Kiloniella laminariae]